MNPVYDQKKAEKARADAVAQSTLGGDGAALPQLAATIEEKT